MTALQLTGPEASAKGVWTPRCAHQHTVCPARLTQDVGEVVWGSPWIIPNRIALEEAFLSAVHEYLDPTGITNRWTNYTAHPSQTPGKRQRPPVADAR